MLPLRALRFLPPSTADVPPAFHEARELQFNTSITFFVGENGSGKSTLLENLADQCGFGLIGGGRNNQGLSDSHLVPLQLKLVWNQKATQGFFMRAESFFNFASYLEQLQKENPGSDIFRSYGGKSLHEQSHGESFLALFQNRFESGLFILDEPEAALSPQRQLAFLKVLHDLSQKDGTQFLIATHSPILLTYPGATIYSLDDNFKKVAYADTKHFTLTKEFLDAPERYYRHLFE